MEKINGTWMSDHGSRQNLEEFTKAMNIPAEMAKELEDRKYKISYQVIDDKTMKASMCVVNRPNLGSKEYTIVLDQEAEVEGLDGDKSKCKVTFDGSKFVETYCSEYGDFTIEREFSGDKMITTTKNKGNSWKETWNKC